MYRQQQVFSIQELAISFTSRIDRNKIFPPSYFNQPTDFIVVNAQQRSCVIGNSFLFCCKNVKEEANRCGNGNMRIIISVAGILWRGSTDEEKDVYNGLYTSAKNHCAQINATQQQPMVVIQAQPPNPNDNSLSDIFNTGFAFNTVETEEFSSILNTWGPA
jgi:hypothetical protein